MRVGYNFRGGPWTARQRWIWAIAAVVAVAVVAGVSFEIRTSWLQARIFGSASRGLDYEVVKRAVEPPPLPRIGPYDVRVGYSTLPAIVDRLTERGYRVIAQADPSPRLRQYLARGLYPVPFEKTQAGLTLLDRAGRQIFQARYPRRVYDTFEDIPPLLVSALLYVENRELLDNRYPSRNPAVEWDRVAKAALELGLRLLGADRNVPGGSTLAVQLDKYRHSPAGITGSIREKLRQVLSASLRAYSSGSDTRPHRRQIVLDFINSVPLAAAVRHGEVHGLGDGLWVWYGADFAQVNTLLRGAPKNDAGRKLRARAFYEALSLVVAHSRPTYFLIEDPGALRERTRFFLRELGSHDLAPPDLVRAALDVETAPRGAPPPEPPVSFVERKAANAVRPRLLDLLGVPSLYVLDRLDLAVGTTLDRALQVEATRLLRTLTDPDSARALGLVGPRLLGDTDKLDLVYGFTLYERGENQNRLLVRTDTFDQPLDINEGIKLELGSTAKLRTLVNYLEIIADLHDRLVKQSAAELASAGAGDLDRLSRWAVGYLAAARDTSLTAMLDAAMSRRYAADPNERFVTGGGVHTFHNFDPEDDGRVFSVEEGFQRSINLVFVRVMRDIVDYYLRQVPGSTHRVLQDMSEPLRRSYLEKFADREGRTFLRRFYRRLNGQSPDEILAGLTDEPRATFRRIVAIYRSLRPNAGFDEVAEYARLRLDAPPAPEDLRRMYEQFDPARLDLNDRAFLARVHPLELWLAAYLGEHPRASWTEVVEASTDVRQEVYEWLFETRQRNKQDRRIRSLMEVEAFLEVRRVWQRLGFPFDYVVPSYATAIGSSGDTPEALAQLAGILLNGGVRKPAVRVERLEFGSETPFQVALVRGNEPRERVLRAEVAEVALRALHGVVEHGTARRLPVILEDVAGEELRIGGKTGTGDNRRIAFDRHGRQIASSATSRTSAFVFTIGDRYFGVMLAYAAGPEADRYQFTSALAVEVFRLLLGRIGPILGSMT